MGNGSTHVGMDVHLKTIFVAMYVGSSRTPVEWQLSNEVRAIKRLIRKLKREGDGEIRCCYEAGPCGYVLQRRLLEGGVLCDVIAPALIPVKPGERIKTDRRDAKKLGEMYRAGMLTVVHPPSAADEAVRDVCRCHDDCREELMSARQRLSKFLLRRGMTYYAGKKAWTHAHRTWLRSLKFAYGADQVTFDSYLLAVEQIEARKEGMAHQLEALSHQEPYRDAVGWLRCFRGIDTVTAMTIVSELHDFRRFQSPRELMAYLGLVPSEMTSIKVKRGAITKAGNGHVRRVLVEAGWHSRHRPMVGVVLRKRRKDQPGAVIAIADKAMQRLHRRYWALVSNGKENNKAVVAVARELVGFIWAALWHRGEPAGASTC